MTPTVCVPVPATPYSVNVAPQGGLRIVVEAPDGSGQPFADVTAVLNPRNTSALASTAARMTDVPGGTSQILTPALPVVGTVV